MQRSRDALLVVPIIKSVLHSAAPDIGLGLLASALRKSDREVAILDCTKLRLGLDEFRQYIQSKRFGVVGFKVFSKDLESVGRMTGEVRAVSPDTLIVLGGAHPSGSPDDVLDTFPQADFAFRGEAEEGLPLLLGLVERGETTPERLAEVPGLIYRTEHGVRTNAQGVVADLERVGMPAWDLMNPAGYESCTGVWPLAKHRRTAPLHVVRGCPHQCAFCVCHNTSSRIVRTRSIDIVMRELRLLVEEYGVREFHIIDDCFTSNRHYVLEFCAALKRENLGLVWACPVGVRIDTLDVEVLRAMEDAGCYGAVVGIESGSQRVLDFVKKRLTLDLIREKTALVKETTNWLLGGFFLFGLPTETRKEIATTIEFAASLPLDAVLFTSYHPVKGAALYDYVRENEFPNRPEIRLTKEYGELYVVDYWPEGMSRAEISALVRKAYWKFFMADPRRIVRLVIRVRSFWQFRRLLQRILFTVVREPMRAWNVRA